MTDTDKEYIAQLESTKVQLTTNFENQNKFIEELTKSIKELNSSTAKLKEQINNLSQSTSKPPSSDSLGKPMPIKVSLLRR